MIAQIVGESMGVIILGPLVGWSVTLVIAIDVNNGSVDLPVFTAVPLMLLLMATLSCWLAARRASRVEPMAALRQE